MPARLESLYQHSLALLTDLYQLTMAVGYWKSSLAEREAVFQLTFRTAPFGGGFALAAGLADVIGFVERFRYSDDDLAYLATLCGADGQRLFSDGFLKYLERLKLSCEICAIPEGTAVFPHEPLVRVRGPLVQCQLLETPLLTLVNFPTLIATKAARVCWAARGEPVLEFGLRRAQGIDGGITAARAAFIGGCTATSNVLAGKLFDIPVKGTHAHSWVMTFDQEREAFESYADALPNNCIFLVDTYDSVEGVRNAIEVGLALRRQGHEMIGVRLDSGDLTELSVAARRLLDEAGFPQASIVASNDLDEYRISELKQQGAAVNVWGVGTRLTTAFEQPALGGVYKLAAIADEAGKLQPRIKLSSDPIKTSTPGVQQVRRFRAGGHYLADCIFKESLGVDEPPADVQLADGSHIPIPADAEFEDLLQPIFRDGHLLYNPPSLPDIQSHARRELAQLPGDVTRIRDAANYPVGLEVSLQRLKQQLIDEARQ